MGMFEIDDPNIDVEALEKRVKAAIEAKRGVRFTDEELDELRGAELKPRLRRQDLPGGWLDGMPDARSKLPEIDAPPGSKARYQAPPAEELWESGAGGAKGAFLRVFRRLARPLVRASMNIEWVLARMNSEMGDATGKISGDINDQGSWTGQQLSEMTGQIDRWRDRDLHLYHNLVREITALRLQQTHMQDRINELIRELDTLKQRERALESLVVPSASEQD